MEPCGFWRLGSLPKIPGWNFYLVPEFWCWMTKGLEQSLLLHCWARPRSQHCWGEHPKSLSRWGILGGLAGGERRVCGWTCKIIKGEATIKKLPMGSLPDHYYRPARDRCPIWFPVQDGREGFCLIKLSGTFLGKLVLLKYYSFPIPKHQDFALSCVL